MSRAQAAKQREENEIEFSRIVAFSDSVITLLLASIPVALLDPHLAPYCWMALFVGALLGLASRVRRQS